MPSNQQTRKLSPTQQKINALCDEVKVKIKLLLSEPWRNLTDTEENRAKVECMVKGASVQYGPQLVQKDPERTWMFDAARLMYTRRQSLTDGLDLDDFFSSGETYNGETHLAINVDFDTWLLIVKRTMQGIVGLGKKATPQHQLKLCFSLARVLRHVETFSCWRNQGVNSFTGETFLYNWPREQASLNNNFYNLTVVERTYDTENFNSFGLYFRAKPVLEEDEPIDFDTLDNPVDLKKATVREHNKSVRDLGNMIGE